MVAAVASLAAFIQVVGGACTQGAKQFGHGPRGGVGIHLHSSGTGKADTDRQGFPRALPFPFSGTSSRAPDATQHFLDDAEHRPIVMRCRAGGPRSSKYLAR